MNYLSKSRIYRIFLAGFVLVTIAIFFKIYYQYPFFWDTKYCGKPKEQWITVFVHGSFASLLGFLNFSDVLNDRLSGTVYRNINKKMRNDPFFFKDQPIAYRGLIAINPTFEPSNVEDKNFVIYPIVKAYQTILDAVHPNQEKNYFYTFGWTGLMSQKSRRFESIRLYNALCEEIERLKARGIKARIRLIGHSHAGNLFLNLAAIRKALRFAAWDDDKNIVSDSEKNESIKQMILVLKELTTKEIAKTKIDQKIYDYVPEKNDLVIDELIMLGTPIQPETECFTDSSMFKNVYNFYSHSDVVQRLDWVTSKNPFSNQRISRFPSLTNNSDARKNRIIQARLVAEKPVIDNKINLGENGQTIPEITPEEISVFDSLLSKRALFLKETKDPNHKDLWFMQWQDEGSPFNSFLAPLPVVILTPLIIRALETTSHSRDVDIDIVADDEKITAYIADYKKAAVLGSLSIPRSIITHIQEKIKAWRPEDHSHTTDFEVAYEHLWK